MATSYPTRVSLQLLPHELSIACLLYCGWRDTAALEAVSASVRALTAAAVVAAISGIVVFVAGQRRAPTPAADAGVSPSTTEEAT